MGFSMKTVGRDSVREREAGKRMVTQGNRVMKRICGDLFETHVF